MIVGSYNEMAESIGLYLWRIRARTSAPGVMILLQETDITDTTPATSAEGGESPWTRLKELIYIYIYIS